LNKRQPGLKVTHHLGLFLRPDKIKVLFFLLFALVSESISILGNICWVRGQYGEFWTISFHSYEFCSLAIKSTKLLIPQVFFILPVTYILQNTVLAVLIVIIFLCLQLSIYYLVVAGLVVLYKRWMKKLPRRLTKLIAVTVILLILVCLILLLIITPHPLKGMRQDTGDFTIQSMTYNGCTVDYRNYSAQGLNKALMHIEYTNSYASYVARVGIATEVHKDMVNCLCTTGKNLSVIHDYIILNELLNATEVHKEMIDCLCALGKNQSVIRDYIFMNELANSSKASLIFWNESNYCSMAGYPVWL
jgi:hypothetical protein